MIADGDLLTSAWVRGVNCGHTVPYSARKTCLRSSPGVPILALKQLAVRVPAKSKFHKQTLMAGGFYRHDACIQVSELAGAFANLPVRVVINS